MDFVITTRPIPTFSTVIPSGLRMRVIGDGWSGHYNLAGLTGWPRVSHASPDSFTLYDGDNHGIQGVDVARAAQAESRLDIRFASPGSVHETSNAGESAALLSGPQAIAKQPEALVEHGSCPGSGGSPSDSAGGRTAIFVQPLRATEAGDDLYAYFDGVRRPEILAAERQQRATIESRESGVGSRESGSVRRYSAPGSRLQTPDSRLNLDQANAELSGLRDRTPAEVCPFDLLPATPLRAFVPSCDHPLPVIEYTSPERLAMYNAKQFPHRAGEHPRRHEWGPEWRIAEIGTVAPQYQGVVAERVIFCADCSTRRDDSGKEWRQFVDLDRGEFRDWAGPWRSLELTTEARRRGDIGGVQVCHGDAEKELSAAVGSVDHTTADSTASDACKSPIPSVPLCLRGGSIPSPHPLGPGWRTVIHDGLPVARFGADSQADLPAWLKSMRSTHLTPETV